MTSPYLHLLTDLKAAARIGHPASLALALDVLRALPPVAANQPLSPRLLQQLILPAGRALAHPRLPLAHLRSLAQDPLAAVRALAAVALAIRWSQDHSPHRDELTRAARDPRNDVRAALAMALKESAPAPPQQLFDLVEAWLTDDSPRLRQVALGLIPTLAATHPDGVFALLSPLHQDADPDVRAALVAALAQLSQDGCAPQVLDLLSAWSEASHPNAWVIARALSASWAARHPDQALRILRMLVEQLGTHKQVLNALGALARHGADQQVTQALADWAAASHPHLRALARKLSSTSLESADTHD